MLTDSPGDITRVLGELEDSMAEQQQEHAQLTGEVKKWNQFLKTWHSNLVALSEGPVGAREHNAWSIIQESKDYAEHLDRLKRHAELEENFNYYKARASIGQSILRSLAEEAAAQRFGKGAQGQWRTQEPND